MEHTRGLYIGEERNEKVIEIVYEIIVGIKKISYY